MYNNEMLYHKKSLKTIEKKSIVFLNSGKLMILSMEIILFIFFFVKDFFISRLSMVILVENHVYYNCSTGFD